jgi:hypothetical protein
MLPKDSEMSRRACHTSINRTEINKGIGHFRLKDFGSPVQNSQLLLRQSNLMKIVMYL